MGVGVVEEKKLSLEGGATWGVATWGVATFGG